MSEVEVFIGDVLLPSRPDPRAVEAGGQSSFDQAAEKLASLGERIANLFASMRPNGAIFDGTPGADGYELEVGFSIEVGAGGVLKLILSPKVGMSCRAKMTWKKP